MNGHPMRPGDPLVLRHGMDVASAPTNRDDRADSILLGGLAEVVRGAAAHPEGMRTVRRGDAPISWIGENAFGRLRIGVVAGAAAPGDRGMMEIEIEHHPSDGEPTRRVVVETFRARNAVDYHAIMGPATLERLAALLSSAAASIEDQPIDLEAVMPAIHSACLEALADHDASRGTSPGPVDFLMIEATPFTPSTLKRRDSEDHLGNPDLPPIALLHRPAREPMRLSPMVHVTRAVRPPDAMEVMRSTNLLLELYGRDASWGA